MHSVSLTTRLGLAAILGAIAVVILAHSKDRANLMNRCKAENCTISTASIDQILRRNIPKSTQQNKRSADGKMILGKKDESVQAIVGTGSEPVSKKPAPRLAKKDKSVQAIAVTGSEPVSKKPAQRLAKKDKSAQAIAVMGSAPVRRKPAQPLAKKPAQRLVEAPQVPIETPQQQFRRSRRDDGYTW